MRRQNVDPEVVEDFGAEWSRFDQSALSEAERRLIFDHYFAVFPWDKLKPDAVGFDLGCGTGRWAVLVAPRVGHLHCIDPSDAIDIAARNLHQFENCSFHRATVDDIPLTDGSMDFGYALGVLHHIPDPKAGLISCVNKLKQGAPFLLYVYYAFDNQPQWFRMLWKASDLSRKIISSLPRALRYPISQIIVILVYLPLVRIARLLEWLGVGMHSFPLSAYRDKSFYTMRTDGLDRFGTKLERRFTRAEIEEIMEDAGLEGIKFSTEAPFWCAVGYKK